VFPHAAIAFPTLRTSRNKEPTTAGQLSRGIPETAGRAWNRLRRAVRLGLKGLFRPFRARVSVWVPLTQAVGLGREVHPAGVRKPWKGVINPPIRLRGRPRVRRNPISPFQGLRPKKRTDFSDPGLQPGLCSSAPSGLILASVALVPPASSERCGTCSGEGGRRPISVNLSSLGWRSTSKKRHRFETGLQTVAYE
jgi:hypothetical protein